MHDSILSKRIRWNDIVIRPKNQFFDLGEIMLESRPTYTLIIQDFDNYHSEVDSGS
jgi:hypothetical protein